MMAFASGVAPPLSRPRMPARPVSLPTYHQLSRVLLHQLRQEQMQGRQRLLDTLRNYGIPWPSPVPSFTGDPPRVQLDHELQRALSELVHRGFSLVAVAELVRGQCEFDYRPNKALFPDRYAALLVGYKHQHFMISVARTGITPDWSCQAPRQSRLPVNHKAADRHLNAVFKSIRKGQDAGQYLVLHEEVLPMCDPVQVSPLGPVEKNGADADFEVRLIDDLSYPKGSATIDTSLRERLPSVEYRHVAAIARRIEECHCRYPNTRICILKGDVQGAFRHLMMASAHVRWMAARVPQTKTLIFDLAAPFGWTCSPTCYGVFGGAISWLLGRERPAPHSTSTFNTP